MKPFELFRNVAFVLASFLFSASFVSCSDDETEEPPFDSETKQTILMYMPWSGSGIYTYFLNNISAFEQAVENNHGFDGNALMVFISENETRSNLIRIVYENGECRRDTLRQYIYSDCNYTTSAGIAEILNDAFSEAPAQSYALTVGCHGMGWIPVGTSVTTRAQMFKAYGHQPKYLTRYFGHDSDSRYQTDITTLAEGIETTGKKMNFILFDDCYMSNIETAYNLRNVTDYLIASTCEIMIDGMPYTEIGKDLFNNDYEAVVNDFYSFYSAFEPPCGTIGVTDCRETEQMANIMRQINTAFPDGVDDLNSIQALDGYTSTIFFDFGDYVSKLCSDRALLDAFNAQLDRLVPYKSNTETFYSMFWRENNGFREINAYSGITISDPTVNSSVVPVINQTEWYMATH